MEPTKFVVVELQTLADGQIASITTDYDTRREAESHWHEVMKYAALNTIPVHAAIMVDNLGIVYLQGHYDNPVEAE